MKANNTNLTAERLRNLVVYDPESGLFEWRTAPKNQYGARREAGGISRGDAYHRIKIDGHLYLSHRLAWFWMTGEWPVDQIDHIDGNKRNNRWSNLRAATNSKNVANVGKRSDNTSGYKGVSLHISGKWTARIMKDGVSKSLGLFDTPEEAYKSYEVNAPKLFGEYARVK